jgi:hypothetical protein
MADQSQKQSVELEILLDKLKFERALYEENLTYQLELHKHLLRQAQSNAKALDFQLEVVKSDLRPHKIYHAEIFYSPVDGRYICRLPTMFDDEDENSVYAYGDTPAQACDNFDYRWIHGENPNLEV